MFFVDVLSRFFHVSTAITLVGGSLFSLLILIPAAKQLADYDHQTFAEAIRARWKMVVHAGIAVLLVTGFYNYIRAMPLHKGDGIYHALIGTKILIALVVFFIASALVGRSPALQSIRDRRVLWLRILVALSLVIVALSAVAKVRGVS